MTLSWLTITFLNCSHGDGDSSLWYQIHNSRVHMHLPCCWRGISICTFKGTSSTLYIMMKIINTMHVLQCHCTDISTSCHCFTYFHMKEGMSICHITWWYHLPLWWCFIPRCGQPANMWLLIAMRWLLLPLACHSFSWLLTNIGKSFYVVSLLVYANQHYNAEKTLLCVVVKCCLIFIDSSEFGL